MLGQSYIEILFISVPLVFLNIVFFTALAAAGDTKTALYINIFVVMLNGILDYVLIFGHAGFTPMGVQGAAIATVCSMLFESTVFLILYLRYKTAFTPVWHFSKRLVNRVFKVGIPAMIDRMLSAGSMLIFTGVILSLGTTVYASFQIGFRIEGLAFMPGIGFAFAASVLMGQGLGAKKPEQSYHDVMLALHYTATIMFSVSLIFILMPERLILFFTDDEAIVRETSLYLIIIGSSQVPLAVYFVLSNALRGAGDTKRAFKINILTLWFVRIIPGIIAVYYFHSVIGVYLAIVAETSVKAVIFWHVFKKGEWRRLKV